MQEYIKTDQQLHWLSQLIAKVNRTYVPKRDDDGHTNLFFDNIASRIPGRWFEAGKDQVIFGLNIQYQRFEWLDKSSKVLHNIPVFNKSMEELEHETAHFLKSLNNDTKKFHEPLHFEIPDYGIEKLNPDRLSSQGINDWMFYRTIAAQSAQSFLGHLQTDGEIRIWPHHFDTGVYTMVTSDLGIGYGLAMKDDMLGEPYFYLAGYNSNQPIQYDNMNQLSFGAWKTGPNWNGAVLPFSTINGFSATVVRDVIETFIYESVKWYLKTL